MQKNLNSLWRAVREMQQRLQDLNPGSSEADITEHAISLAIDSQCQAKNWKFFYYDRIKNARFSLRRTKARQSRAYLKAALNFPAYSKDAESYAALELEEQLRVVVSASGKNLSQCFDDMLNGKSVAATALACGVSQRTANRLRQKVREIVQTYLNAQDAA